MSTWRTRTVGLLRAARGRFDAVLVARIRKASRRLGYRNLIWVGNAAIFVVLVGFGAALATRHFSNAEGVGELSDSLTRIGDALTVVTREQQPFVMTASGLQAQVLDMQLELLRVTTEDFVPGSYLADKANALTATIESLSAGFLDEATQFRITELQSQVRNYGSLIVKIPEARTPVQAQTMAHRSLALGDQIIAVSAALQGEIFEFIHASNNDSLTLAQSAAQTGETIADRVRSAAIAEVITFAAILIVILFLTFMVRAAIAGPLKRVSNSIRELAAGNLTERMAVHGEDDIAVMAREFNTAVAEIQQIVTEVRMATGAVSTGARELLTFAEMLSRNAHSQAVALEETAASLESLTSTVHANAERSEQANGLTTDNLQHAQQGGAVVSQTISAMDKIRATSSCIAESSLAIREIALQTKMLALNAAIEAAHAGHEARGFAVVAAEVREMAARSRETADNISTLVEDAQERAQEGARMANESGDMLAVILESSGNVSRFMDSISDASRSQAMGLDQVGSAVSEMNDMTQELTGQVDKISDQARKYAHLAENLEELVQRFKIDTDDTEHADSQSDTDPR